jgi:hypothetical protein
MMTASIPHLSSQQRQAELAMSKADPARAKKPVMANNTYLRGLFVPVCSLFTPFGS